jgi:hypothetical protein
MRRLVYLLILVLAVGASATGVSASTDCERWFAAYRSELAHSQSLQRLAAAKRRARRYAQRKLAGYVKPKPAVTVPHGPRMTPRESLHKVELACGVLPESSPEQPLLAEEEHGEFIPEVAPPDELGILPGFDGPPGTILPEEAPPPPVFSEAPPAPPVGGAPVFISPFTTPLGGGKTPPPTGGSGGTPPPTGGGGTPPPGGGPGGGTPPPGGGPGGGTPPPGGGGGIPPPGGGGETPPPVVPEPSSIVLLLTGAVGAAGVVRRRFKA